MLSMSACAEFELFKPPPIETAFNPLPPPPPPPAPPQSLTPPSPEETRAEIYRWFMVHGYQQFQAEALMEHAQTESGYRACAAGPGGYRYLYQWSSTRLEQLQKFAGYAGCPQLHTQLAFADKELRNDPKFSCFWAATTEDAAYSALRRGFGRGSC
jgi:Phage tail lysozyme